MQRCKKIERMISVIAVVGDNFKLEGVFFHSENGVLFTREVETGKLPIISAFCTDLGDGVMRIVAIVESRNVKEYNGSPYYDTKGLLRGPMRVVIHKIKEFLPIFNIE